MSLTATLAATLALTTPAIKPSCDHLYKAKDYKSYATQVYQRPKISKRAEELMRSMRSCQKTPQGQARVESHHKKLLKDRKVQKAREAAEKRLANQWAIPWAIVKCESGGKNTGPNSAGASGYYQFIPSTWRSVGGSTAHAYQASKAEQNRRAAILWNGGKGRYHWDCTRIVGLG